MKASTSKLLLIAGGLVLAGLLLASLGWMTGGTPAQIWETGLSGLPFVSIGGESSTGFRDWDSAYSKTGEYAVDAAGIDSLRLDWLAGNVEVKPGEGTDIRFAERASGKIEPEKALRWGVQEGTLYIQYCPKGEQDLPRKDFTLTLPAALAGTIDSFHFEGRSADLTLSALRAEKLTASSVSGALRATDAEAGKVSFDSNSGALSYEGVCRALYMDTVSGAVKAECTGETEQVELGSISGSLHFSGSYRELNADATSGTVTVESLGRAAHTKLHSTSGDCSARGNVGELYVNTVSGATAGRALYAETVKTSSTSGSVRLEMLACPDSLRVETTSGTTALTLPEDSGFTLRFDTVSGSLDSAFAMRMEKNRHICGSGAADFEVDSTSGSLTIREG